MIQEPTSYDSDRLAENESVTFLCRDQNARPAPSLVWFIDGNMVNGMDSRFNISEENNRYVYYTIVCTSYIIIYMEFALQM